MQKNRNHVNSDTVVIADGVTSIFPLASQVPLYELRCNMDQEAALVAYEGMRN